MEANRTRHFKNINFSNYIDTVLYTGCVFVVYIESLLAQNLDSRFVNEYLKSVQRTFRLLRCSRRIGHYCCPVVFERIWDNNFAYWSFRARYLGYFFVLVFMDDMEGKYVVFEKYFGVP
jgi:hypothetical protein